MFFPWYRISPLEGLANLKIKLEIVVLPDPDSPTIPKTSLGYKLKLTSSQAIVS